MILFVFSHKLFEICVNFAQILLCTTSAQHREDRLFTTFAEIVC